MWKNNVFIATEEKVFKLFKDMEAELAINGEFLNNDEEPGEDRIITIKKGEKVIYYGRNMEYYQDIYKYGNELIGIPADDGDEYMVLEK